MKTRTLVIAVIIALCIGVLLGVAAQRTSDAAHRAKTAEKQLSQADKTLTERLAAEQLRANQAQADLNTERDKSLDLRTQVATLSTRNAALEDQITHAPFDAPVPAPVAGVCPGNPLAGDDFNRLYNAAATGGATPGS